MKKISDNKSAKEISDGIKAFDTLAKVAGFIPFIDSSEKLKSFVNGLENLKDQSEILGLPDRFNEKFSQVGWIAYESMSVDLMKRAIQIAETEGIEAAEKELADHYDEDALKFGLLRFKGNLDCSRRIRLLKLAAEDYLAARYHACVPLLLSLSDGLVNDISKHVGLFAENSDMVVPESIAAHETGLKQLAKIWNIGRNKTTDGEITIPFRNGILHGRDLGYDNKIVAAKCWAALFAVRDWATSREKIANPPPEKKTNGWKETLAAMVQLERDKKVLDEWKPRQNEELVYLPASSKGIEQIPVDAPERVVADFLLNWMKGRYGPMAGYLPNFAKASLGKKAGEVKETFGQCRLIDFTILGVNDPAMAISMTKVIITVEKQTKKDFELEVRTFLESEDESLVNRNLEKCSWKIVQNVFNEAIYGIW
jgi:hypothetical protein